MNFFDHKDLGNHLLQLCPKVVKHPAYIENILNSYAVSREITNKRCEEAPIPPPTNECVFEHWLMGCPLTSSFRCHEHKYSFPKEPTKAGKYFAV